MRRALPLSFALAFATLASAAAVVTISSDAAAEGPSAADKASARTLANEGDAALRKKDFATAYDKYTKAGKLMPDALTLTLGLARAQLGLGKLVEAKESYNNIVRTALQPGAAPAYKAAKAEAEKEILGIDTRIGSLVITLDGPSDAAVTVDGDPVSPVMIGEKRPTNPGERLVRATAPGYRPAEEKVVVKEGAKAELKLTLEKDGPKAPPPKIEAPSVPDEAPPPPPPSSGLRTGAWVAAGVGVAGLAVGGVFGFLAKGKHDDLTKTCAGGELCPMSQKSNIDSFKSSANISTIGFIVGGVGVAAAIPLFAFSGSPKESPKASATFLTVSPSSVAVNGSF